MKCAPEKKVRIFALAATLLDVYNLFRQFYDNHASVTQIVYLAWLLALTMVTFFLDGRTVKKVKKMDFFVVK